MDVSTKSMILIAAVIFTGLSAGLFYAWSVSVIPGTQKVTDASYLETMQSINRAILNPVFFLVFFGSMVLLGTSTFFAFPIDKTAFWFLLTASVFYTLGTVGVTALGNVPLNNQLEALNLNVLSAEEQQTFRQFYEMKWNRLHLARTLFAIAAFILATIGLFIQTKH